MDANDKESFSTAEKPQGDAQPKARGRGGRQSHKNRSDRRRAEANVSKAASLYASFDAQLGLTETTSMKELQPQISTRPTAVSTNLMGFNVATKEMVTRMSSIAIRPLATQLTPANKNIYRRVSCYLATARIAAAQRKVSYAAGVALDLKDAFTNDDITRVDSNASTLPSFQAWLLSHIGMFKTDGQTCVPVLPTCDDTESATIQHFMSANYRGIHYYIRRHAQGGEGVDIPAAERPMVRRMGEVLPEVSFGADHRFSAATVNKWPERPSSADWTIFTEINAAAKEQKLTVDHFLLSSGLGSEQQIVRFPLFEDVNTTTRYYSTREVNATTVRAAIVLRGGVDEFLTDQELRRRFIEDPNTALINGYAMPNAYIKSQLLMLQNWEERRKAE